MDLRQVRYFVAVAETRNFTRAAERLHIAQPPLSRQIQSLEQELGVELLKRDSRPLQLTEAGRIFYEQSIQLLLRVEQMKASTVQVAYGQRQVLQIGFVASTLYGGLPLLLRQLRRLHPELDVRLVELTSVQQIAALKSGRIDMGLGRIRINDRGVDRIVLREERLVLAMHPDFALAHNSAPITLQAVEGQNLIVYPNAPRPSFADHILSLLNDYGVRPAEVQEVRELQTALGLVSAEMGICIVPAAARIRSELVYRSIEDERATSPIILSHRVNDRSWYIEEVKRLITDIYADNPGWIDRD